MTCTLHLTVTEVCFYPPSPLGVVVMVKGVKLTSPGPSPGLGTKKQVL